MKQLIARILRVLKLEDELYREVESVPDAISEAVIIVIISSIAAGIGSLGKIGLTGIIIITLGSLVNWIIWAFLVYFIATNIIRGSRVYLSQGDFLRVVGFASAPGIIRILALLPGMYYIVHIIAHLWMIASMIVAVREVFMFEKTSGAVKVSIVGWVFMVLAAFVLGSAARAVGF
ncbi:MAG: hypothetical protein ABIH89_02530 [Elusimicrobiota bacterium]